MKNMRKIAYIAAMSAFFFGAGASFAMNSPEGTRDDTASATGCTWKRDRNGELMYCCPFRGCIYP